MRMKARIRCALPVFVSALDPECRTAHECSQGSGPAITIERSSGEQHLKVVFAEEVDLEFQRPRIGASFVGRPGVPIVEQQDVSIR